LRSRKIGKLGKSGELTRLPPLNKIAKSVILHTLEYPEAMHSASLPTRVVNLSRKCLYNPPIGVPTRILKLRLWRASRQSRSVSTTAASAETNALKIALEERISNQTIVDQDVATSITPEKPLRQSYKLKNLLNRIETQDTTTIFDEVATLIRELEREGFRGRLHDKLVSLPSTTFSELLRSLDPARVANILDASDGLHLSAGFRAFTAVDSLNKYGVRTLYLQLLRHLRAIFSLRHRAGRPILWSDYKVLLRCAGAASDHVSAKSIWKIMDRKDDIAKRNGEAYAEFIKARFLTEPLYSQYTMERFRVRPRDLNTTKRRLPKATLARLDRLRLSLRANKSDMYGIDPHQEEKTQDLIRVLGRPWPVRRIWKSVEISGATVDEKALASAIVAHGRTASLLEIETLLSQWFGITIVRDKKSGQTQVSGGRDFSAGSPCRPTELLMEALVQALGANAEISLSIQLVDFISSRYGIPISAKTWSSMLAWTYVSASKPASTEWRIMGYHTKIVSAKQVLMVWNAMTSAPYNIKPTFEDRNLYIKALIQLGDIHLALEQMIEGREEYNAMAKEHEDAVFEWVLSKSRGVPKPNSSDIYRAMRRTRIMKDHGWYTVQLWCHKLLKTSTKYTKNKGVFASCTIPRLVDEFREFMPDPVNYNTSSGTVNLYRPFDLCRHRWARQRVAAPKSVLLVNRPSPQLIDGKPAAKMVVIHPRKSRWIRVRTGQRQGGLAAERAVGVMKKQITNELLL
jgi:hypothetical protein